MNMLVDGEWRTDAFVATNEEGAFERQTTPFRNWIAGSDVPDHVDREPDDRFEAEAGRYHLYVSYACPWAHRTLLVRALMGLEDAIDVSVVDPYRGEDGWQFSPEKPGCTADKLHGSDYLRERYVEAGPEATCRVTVPVLWDTKEGTIVNNESREIIRMLSTGFGDVADRDIDRARGDPRPGRRAHHPHLRADQQRRLPCRFRHGTGPLRRRDRRTVRRVGSLRRAVGRPAVPRGRSANRGRHLHVYHPHSIRSRLSHALHV